MGLFSKATETYAVFVDMATDEDVLKGALSFVPVVGDFVSFSRGAFRLFSGTVVRREVLFEFGTASVVVRLYLDDYKVQSWDAKPSGRTK